MVESPFAHGAMGPFDQLVLYLDEQGGKSKLDWLRGRVKYPQGQGETKAFVLRGQEAGFVRLGGRRVTLTAKGRERVAAIRAEQPLDPRLLQAVYSALPPNAMQPGSLVIVQHADTFLRQTEPLSVSLFKKSKRTPRSNAPPPQPHAANGVAQPFVFSVGKKGVVPSRSKFKLDPAAPSFVPRDVADRAPMIILQYGPILIPPLPVDVRDRHACAVR